MDIEDIKGKVLRHRQICFMLNSIYANKNNDYGDSFGLSFKEWGITAAMVRLSDKWNRLKTLTQGTDQKVRNESIEDTILDMCNYLIMTYMELTETKEEEQNDAR